MKGISLPHRESQGRTHFCSLSWTLVGGAALSAARSRGLWLLSRAGFVLHPGSGPSCGWLDLSSRKCNHDCTRRVVTGEWPARQPTVF